MLWRLRRPNGDIVRLSCVSRCLWSARCGSAGTSRFPLGGWCRACLRQQVSCRWSGWPLWDCRIGEATNEGSFTCLDPACGGMVRACKGQSLCIWWLVTINYRLGPFGFLKLDEHKEHREPLLAQRARFGRAAPGPRSLIDHSSPRRCPSIPAARPPSRSLRPPRSSGPPHA